jgi:hypothetical protein
MFFKHTRNVDHVDVAVGASLALRSQGRKGLIKRFTVPSLEDKGQFFGISPLVKIVFNTPKQGDDYRGHYYRNP